VTSSLTATSCAATRSLGTLSIFVTMTTSVVFGATERICSTISVSRTDSLVGRNAQPDHVDLGVGVADQVVEPLAQQGARPVQTRVSTKII